MHLSFISGSWFSDLPRLVVALATGGKFFITSSFAIVYVFSAELYPTVVRGVGVSCSSLFARVGGILAPPISQTLVRHAPLSVCLSVCLCLCVSHGTAHQPDAGTSRTPVCLSVSLLAPSTARCWYVTDPCLTLCLSVCLSVSPGAAHHPDAGTSRTPVCLSVSVCLSLSVSTGAAHQPDTGTSRATVCLSGSVCLSWRRPLGRHCYITHPCLSVCLCLSLLAPPISQTLVRHGSLSVCLSVCVSSCLSVLLAPPINETLERD